METLRFLDGVRGLGVDFYTGVPDSLLKPLNDTLYAQYGLTGDHVVAANEGAAVGLAAGHYIATGHPALVYLQNSGVGNMTNPTASLLNTRVYGIPCVFVVGWRGEPNVKDEPQHAFQGLVTRTQLETLDLTVFELAQDTKDEAFAAMCAQCAPLLKKGNSVAFLVHKNALTGGSKVDYPAPDYRAMREEALRTLLTQSQPEDVFVCTTGKTSREVYELREALGQEHTQDFLTVGSMGHAGMIALGIAKALPERTIWCLDGDGAALMHLGSLVIEAEQRRRNLIHVLLNNGAHESVGGMPVAGGSLWFSPLARSFGYDAVFTAESVRELAALLPRVRAAAQTKLCFVEVLIKPGSRDDLGRPMQTPKENLQALMARLQAPITRSDL